eukprot:2816594-Prorocentrum_lima.AAC.1
MLDGMLIPASVGAVSVSSMCTSPWSFAISPSVVSDDGDICVRSCRLVCVPLFVVARAMIWDIVIVL